MVKYSTNTSEYVKQLIDWIKTMNLTGLTEPTSETLTHIENLINEIIIDLNTHYDNGTDYFDNSKLQDFFDVLNPISSKVIKLLFPNYIFTSFSREKQENIVKTVTTSIARSIVKDDIYELDIFMM
jgi:hypothetical protein